MQILFLHPVFFQPFSIDNPQNIIYNNKCYNIRCYLCALTGSIGAQICLGRLGLQEDERCLVWQERSV